jgi:hypothetical protein
LFNPNTPEIVESLSDEISTAISFWMPYIIINNIDVQNKIYSLGNNAEHGISISINFNVTNRGANQTIVLDINQNGAITVQ